MDESNTPATAAEDPEIEALLRFTPVERRNKRHDGWPPERQRGFIAALAREGNVDRAAHHVDRTASGAWTVRNSAGADEFSDAWDKALALYHARNPRRGPITPSPGRKAVAATPTPPEGQAGPAQDEMTDGEFIKRVLRSYWIKLSQERECRLEGRIVEADFYVRQLSWLEVVLDIGGNSIDVLNGLKRGGVNVMNIVATPMSLLLNSARRYYWAETDERERPPFADLGLHDDEVSTGPWTSHSTPRDGEYGEWRRRKDEEAAMAAEAQRLWEEKARTDPALCGSRTPIRIAMTGPVAKA